MADKSTEPAAEWTLTNHFYQSSRKLHDLSNTLVWARLAVLFTDRQLYGKALGCFWFIFSAIEEALGVNQEHPDIAPMMPVISRMLRAPAYQKDLEYFLGSDWQAQLVETPAIKAYTSRLREIGKNKPTLLLAHCYTQYLAATGGGQIIRQTARKKLRLPEDRGTAAFEFQEPSNTLKLEFKERLNALGQRLSKAQVDELVAEHAQAFRFNNDIIRSFKISLPRTVWAMLTLLPQKYLAVVVLLLSLLVAGLAYLLKGV